MKSKKLPEIRVSLYSEDFKGKKFQWVLKDLQVPFTQWDSVESIDLLINSFIINDQEETKGTSLVKLFAHTIKEYIKEYGYLTTESQDEAEILAHRLCNIVLNQNRVEDYEDYLTIVGGKHGEE